jgi:hypothetical protein
MALRFCQNSPKPYSKRDFHRRGWRLACITAYTVVRASSEKKYT